MLILLVVSMATLALHIQLGKAQGSIYIRADGSVDPPSAPISSVDGVKYDFTDNIYSEIVIERSNIAVDGHGYTLQGENSGKGFCLSSVNNVTIQNTNITYFWCGVYIGSSSLSTICGINITTRNYFGVIIDSSSSNTVSENSIVNCAQGITITSTSDYNTVAKNNITHCQVGVDIEYSSSNNTISQNDIEDSSEAGSQEGIFIYDSCDNNVVSGNSVENHLHGISVVYSSNNVLKNNRIINSQYGFNVEPGELFSTYINDVDTSNTVDGKPIYYLINQRNLIINPSTHVNIGYLALVNSAEIIVEGLDLRKNGQGILLANTTNSQIKNNNISDNWNGLYFMSSSNNVVSGNNITSNTFGADFEFSSSNRFYHNNFNNNAGGVYNYVSSNSWDNGYPSGGNHWSGYSGVDIKKGPDQIQHGSDGIGDVPYAIDGENEDRYPLMNQFGSPLPPMYTLTTVASIGGSSDPAPGTYSYSQGQNVPVQAIPDQGYYFNHWDLDGNDVGYGSAIIVAMNAPHTLTANFELSIPPVPEFPLGHVFEIAFIPIIMYLWWKKKHKRFDSLDHSNKVLND